jgi:phosphoribosylformylglycinamidine cyclo-ligase
VGTEGVFMTDQPGRAPASVYAQAGVDEEREQAAFARVMRPWLARTAVRSPMVTGISGLSSGYFATLIQLPPGPPLAVTTDGVGTKILLARLAGRYRGIGADCVANNVNDLICVGAVPLIMLDYLATDRIDEDVLAQLAEGMSSAAQEAGIAIPGGEIAQIGEMLAPAGDGPPMLDLVGTALGALPAEPGGGWRQPVDGAAVRPGDVVIGLPSSGLHSNGYSLARQVLLERGALSLDEPMPGSGRTVGAALLEPTRIYVHAIEALWAAGLTPHGLVHISGGGLLNLARLAADVSYTLDQLPPQAGLFTLIAQLGELPASVMYATFNMGIGFCVVVRAGQTAGALGVLTAAGERPLVIGHADDRPGRLVTIPDLGLTGRADVFRQSP